MHSSSGRPPDPPSEDRRAVPRVRTLLAFPLFTHFAGNTLRSAARQPTRAVRFRQQIAADRCREGVGFQTLKTGGV